MSSYFSKTKKWIIAHRIVSGIVAVVLVFGIYKMVRAFSSGTTQTTYVVAEAQNNTVVSTVSGSGQVSASNEIDVTSKASGPLVSLNVHTGQEVKAGDVIAEVDPKTAVMNLQSAKIALQKLTNPDDLSVTQAQNNVETSKQSIDKANEDLAGYYTNALASLASSYVDFPQILTGLTTMFYTSTGTLNDVDTTSLPLAAQQYRNDAGVNLDSAKLKYNSSLLDYQAMKNTGSTTDTEKNINETLDTAQTLMLAVKNAKSTIDYLKNNNQDGTLKNTSTAETNLNTWLNEISSDVTSLATARNSIQNGKLAISSAQRDLQEKQDTLQALYKGSSDLDVQSQQLTVTQRVQDYEDYFIRAPFDGVIAKVNVGRYDNVNSGTSIVTLVAKQKVAEITLNEVDISKVKVGQNATLTFDAIDGLTLTGKVAEADQVGTVSQGVVSYAVKIAFDVDDSRVLSGMSVNATIATDVEQDVLTVPNSAIKTQGGTSYVQRVTDPSVQASETAQALSSTPTQQEVTVGISDDTNTQIVSGLSQGDKVVTRTVASTIKTTTTASAPSLFGAAGGGGNRSFGGGAARTTGK